MLPASLSYLAPQLSQALETWQAEPSTKGFAVVSIPAPLTPLARVFAAGQSNRSFLWAPNGGCQFVAEGVAAEASASGSGRFADVRDQVQRLLANVRASDEAAPAPRVFGGFSFQADAPRGTLWSGFGSARFVLPRTCYCRTDTQAWISLSVGQKELSEPGRIRDLTARTVMWLEGLMARPAIQAESSRSRRLRNMPDRDRWRELVHAIKDEISRGGFLKIVAARQAICHLDPAPAPDQVLKRLEEIAQDCTRFAVRQDDKLFLGATPEWLVRKHGRRVETEAMAGSRASGEPLGDSRLLASQKDLGEHALVVEEILRALRPLTTELVVPSAPSVRRLRDILHLYTPISAALGSDVHVLDLVERLHPTPAVGGTPRHEAERWISAHEPEERGWYASPVGWVDANGDGQFAVALRSALLAGNRAHVFAGAGIVAESDAELEFEETELKLRAMVHALGAS